MLTGKLLCIDLFCGLGGWTEGFLAEGWDVVGFDIQQHMYALPEKTDEEGDGRKNTKPVEKRGWTQGCAITLGMEGTTQRPRTRLAKYPAQLVLQDVLTIHGSQFKNADCIVASPPCQAYSWLAMPWSKSKDPENSKAAKALRKKWETEGPDNRLFDACFRIQREACEAAGHAIPLIIENVRGARPWVGNARANYGSFYLWGDVEQIGNRIQAGKDIGRFGTGLKIIVERKREGRNFNTWAVTGGAVSSPSYHGGEHETRGVGLGVKTGHTRHLTNQHESDAVKVGGDWFRDPACHSKHGSQSNSRKAASAMIAKIPPALSQYVARAMKP